ncbi:MAG: response regulator, partial [Planctomycetota bacterium]
VAVGHRDVGDDNVELQRAVRGRGLELIDSGLTRVADVLRRRGCDVIACDSGQSAINELEASTADGALQFDVVISDISMPDRNGYEVFAIARGVIADEAIILMTGFGYDPHHSIVRASQQGMQHVLYKPFQATRLLDEVHRAVGVTD